MIGSRLGPYEIVAKLGEGGMAEVYRATDRKLIRDVVIEVLSAAFTSERRAFRLLRQLRPRTGSLGLTTRVGIPTVRV